MRVGQGAKLPRVENIKPTGVKNSDLSLPPPHTHWTTLTCITGQFQAAKGRELQEANSEPSRHMSLVDC